MIQPLILVLISLGFVPVWLASRRASRALHKFAVQQTERDRQRTYLTWVLTHRQMAPEIRAFSLVGFFRSRLDELYRLRIIDLRRLAKQRLSIGMVGTALNGLLTVITMLLLIWLVNSGQIELGAAGAAAGAIILLAERMHGLGGSSGSMYENTLYMGDFTTFVDRLPQIRRDRPTGPAPTEFHTLRAEHLTFTYPSRERPSIRDVSIEIGHNEVVALVGENGSGKTTLAKLLAGLYPPSSGSICWDGTDISGSDPDELHKSVALIFQDFGQYLMSASDNIGLGDVTRFDDRQGIELAGRLAQADEFIRDLPKGYDNILGSEFYGRSEPVTRAVATRRPGPRLFPERPVRHPRRAHGFPRPPRRGGAVRERPIPLSGPSRSVDLSPVLQRALSGSDLRPRLRQGRRTRHPRRTHGRVRPLRGVVRAAGVRLRIGPAGTVGRRYTCGCCQPVSRQLRRGPAHATWRGTTRCRSVPARRRSRNATSAFRRGRRAMRLLPDAPRGPVPSR